MKYTRLEVEVISAKDEIWNFDFDASREVTSEDIEFGSKAFDEVYG